MMQVIAPSTMIEAAVLEHHAVSVAHRHVVEPGDDVFRHPPPPYRKYDMRKLMMKIRMMQMTTALVVDLPTPAAPPRVVRP